MLVDEVEHASRRAVVVAARRARRSSSSWSRSANAAAGTCWNAATTRAPGAAAWTAAAIEPCRRQHRTELPAALLRPLAIEITTLPRELVGVGARGRRPRRPRSWRARRGRRPRRRALVAGVERRRPGRPSAPAARRPPASARLAVARPDDHVVARRSPAAPRSPPRRTGAPQHPDPHARELRTRPTPFPAEHPTLRAPQVAWSRRDWSGSRTRRMPSQLACDRARHVRRVRHRRSGRAAARRRSPTSPGARGASRAVGSSKRVRASRRSSSPSAGRASTAIGRRPETLARSNCWRRASPAGPSAVASFRVGSRRSGELAGFERGRTGDHRSRDATGRASTACRPREPRVTGVAHRRDGRAIPVSSAARTLCDLTAVATAPWMVERAVDDALRRKLVDHAARRRASHATSKVGAGAVRTVTRAILERRRPGYHPGESEPETRHRRRCSSVPGLPAPVRQHRVRVGERRIRARPRLSGADDRDRVRRLGVPLGRVRRSMTTAPSQRARAARVRRPRVHLTSSDQRDRRHRDRRPPPSIRRVDHSYGAERAMLETRCSEPGRQAMQSAPRRTRSSAKRPLPASTR